MSSNPHFIRLRIQATLREGFGDRLTLQALWDEGAPPWRTWA